ncbi:hypothetical protein, partial [Cupriavidus sp. UYPR2.512]|uniref:hypothetical protein n=1 Tax=Cupriavidus sp. UYPR2.512 TaxID=1080187 RepID=UPI001E42CF31
PELLILNPNKAKRFHNHKAYDSNSALSWSEANTLDAVAQTLRTGFAEGTSSTMTVVIGPALGDRLPESNLTLASWPRLARYRVRQRLKSVDS